ncbi:MAG: pilus assembly protein PilP [Candidatus Nitrospinota bacterium M3_3B_026]
MKAKIAVLVLLAAAIAGYWGYSFFLKGGEGGDEKSIKESFQAMSAAIASGNEAVIKSFVAPTFSDKKITRKDLLTALTRKRSVYEARISAVTAQGNLATLIYTRTEALKGGEPVTARIAGETWIRDSKRPAVWRLHRLAPNDKWLRTVEVKKEEKKEKAGSEKDKKVLGTLEAAAGRLAAGEERYSPVGKRDPFRPLIAMTEGPAAVEEVCEPERPRELLENYNLMSLKLAGVIQAGAGEAAVLIEAPDGKGYTVREGMYLGKNCGKVIDIKSDYLLIREKVHTPGAEAGVFEPVETMLKLRPEEG